MNDPSSDRPRISPQIRRWSAGILLLTLLVLLTIVIGCHPITPTTVTSTDPSDTSGLTGPTTSTGNPSTDPTASDTEPSEPEGSSAMTDPTGPSDPSGTTTGSETSTDPTGSETQGTSSDPTGSTGTGSGTAFTTVWSSTQSSAQTTVNTTQPPAPTTTRPASTTTQGTTAATTTVATTTAPPTGSFPVRNYGTYFRNEYGTNAEIVSSPDGAIDIDIGSCPEGVVLVRIVSIPTDKRVKVILKGPSTYQYEITSRNRFEGLPLQASGSYTVTIYEQISGTSYATRFAHSFSVSLGSSLKPFTASSIIVNFSSSSSSTSRASSLCSGKSSQVARIEAVYLWIVGNIAYDRALASSITSGELKTYIPDPERTMSTRKGICYDYAALMAAMLRSQGIPTRLIMGQVPQGYHAWNEVYLAGTGWVVIASFNYWQVDGSAWVMFDSTFAAGGMSSQTILNTTHTKERTY